MSVIIPKQMTSSENRLFILTEDHKLFCLNLNYSYPRWEQVVLPIDDGIPPDYTPIRSLPFKIRTINALELAGILYKEQLVHCSEAKLSSLKNMGTKSINDVKKVLWKNYYRHPKQQ